MAIAQIIRALSMSIIRGQLNIPMLAPISKVIHKERQMGLAGHFVYRFLIKISALYSAIFFSSLISEI
jgi:hypothetical protein